MKQLTNYKRVTGYLDKIFNMLNEAYFDGTLPKVVITVQSTPKAYGHFTTYDAWHCQSDGYKEINIGAGTLDRPIENVTATLLHEMVHEYCLLNGIKDTSRGGAYHNKRFRQEAEKRALHIDYDSRIGWSVTSPTEELIDFCIDHSLEDIQIARDDLISRTTIGGGTGATDRTRRTYTGRSTSHRHICPRCGNIARTGRAIKLICGECMCEMISD